MEEDIWESLRNFEYDDDYKLYGYPNTKYQRATGSMVSKKQR
jgi:hypothetical protein